jgi:hypothetical protein
MTKHAWRSGVLLGGAGIDGQTVRIADTRAAAEFLLSRWSRERNAAYLRAVRACADAMKGKTSPADAAAAFVSAAVEARYDINVFDAFWDEFDAEISRAAEALIAVDLPLWTQGDGMGASVRA